MQSDSQEQLLSLKKTFGTQEFGDEPEVAPQLGGLYFYYRKIGVRKLL
jgi:hypothetical protein